MIKTPTRYSIKYLEEEERILETINSRPELVDSFAKISTGGRKKQQINYEKLASELNCNVETLKKVWFKIQPNDEVKSMRDSSETRPRSTRSNWTEPRENTRSLRSQSTDKPFRSATVIVDDSSMDNSCGSNICSSPKFEENRSQQQQQQSSCRNLEAINEDEVSVEFIDVGLRQSYAQQYAAEETEEEDERKTEYRGSSPNQEDAAVNENGANDHRQIAFNNALDVAQYISQKSTLSKYLDSNLSTDKKKLNRFSEPVKTPRNNQTSHSSNSNNARQSTIAGFKDERPKKNNNKIVPNSEVSTRVFFDSISLTVMNFPQHFQASVKAQVSKIVHELEYKLSSPPFISDNSIAVAS